ncbi:uncharacterized protein [Rutidosis leptorrhynchoides]|uniref:uncharacterized protein isoform X1 n=1 Tax=Rutidosis leptorrhynchoides TaxID=125765 RepID=UPI003A99AF7A
MAIARTFPTGFGFWQTCIVPTDLLVTETTKLAGAAIKLYIIMLFYLPLLIYANIFKKNPIFGVKFETLPYGLLHTGGPTKHFENKKKDWNEATKVLKLVCAEISNLKFDSGTHHPYFTRPLLEAASENVYKVVDEILYTSPEAIQYR